MVWVDLDAVRPVAAEVDFVMQDGLATPEERRVAAAASTVCAHPQPMAVTATCGCMCPACYNPVADMCVCPFCPCARA